MRRNVRPGPVLLVLVGLVAALAVPSTAAAAAKIGGRVTGVNGNAAAAGLHPSVRLLRLGPAYEARTITLPAAGGSFSARVPAGIWAVLTTTYRGGRVSGKVRLYKATTRKAVPIGSGRTVRVAARKVPRPGAGVPLVSVAPLTVAGLGDLSDLVIVDILQAAEKGPCKVHVVEDRSGKMWHALMAEVKLRASRYIDPKDYRSVADSMAILRAWKPTFRVTGTLTMDAGENVSGTLRLVDLKTGQGHRRADEPGGQRLLRRLRGVRREGGRRAVQVPAAAAPRDHLERHARHGRPDGRVELERDVRLPARTG